MLGTRAKRRSGIGCGPLLIGLAISTPAGLACTGGGQVARGPDAALVEKGDVPIILMDTTPVFCGNGIKDGVDTCDDGNTASGDGCDRSCQVEPGWLCPSFGQPCISLCGNGVQDDGEECDDGNLEHGDGCSKFCWVELGFVCPRFGQPCFSAYTCGNGILSPGEICDDGNTVAGDGCAGDCLQVEPGWRCRVPGRPCMQECGVDAGTCADGGLAAACGNGIVEPGEECDDGSDTSKTPHNGDLSYGGCTSECTYGAFCGDGVVNGQEACDEGSKNGDLYGYVGCTFRCTVARYCGDGIVDGYFGEECDLGDENGKTCNCTKSCQVLWIVCF